MEVDDMDPNANINPCLLSVLQREANFGAQHAYSGDAQQHHGPTVPDRNQHHTDNQRRRPFAELRGRKNVGKALARTHAEAGGNCDTTDHRPETRKKRANNRSSRSKSCGPMLQGLHHNNHFGSPMPGVQHDIVAVARQSICPHVIPAGPPDFSTIRPRKALCHQFDWDTRTWTHAECKIRLSHFPFAKGSARHAYYMKIEKPLAKSSTVTNQDKAVPRSRRPRLSFFRPAKSRGSSSHHSADQSGTLAPAKDAQTLPPLEELYVAKRAIDPFAEPSIYFKDVEMQKQCHVLAELFNECNPPRQVQFLNAFVIELDAGTRSIFLGVEPHIDGEYRKHNNNTGVVTPEERNTPQAFSHFTLEATRSQMVVVDIQGVGDMYTDPQIHTVSGKGFGNGNLGISGLMAFYKSHQCNSICKYLGLKSHAHAAHKTDGTMASTETRPLRSTGVRVNEEPYYTHNDNLRHIDNSSSTAVSDASFQRRTRTRTMRRRPRVSDASSRESQAMHLGCNCAIM